MSATMKGCEMVLSKPIGSGVFLVSERGQEGGHEAVPRDLAHRGQHAFVEGRLAQLFARRVDLDSDDLDHGRICSSRSAGASGHSVKGRATA